MDSFQGSLYNMYNKSMSDKPTSIDEYIAGQPEHAQKILEGIRKTIKKALPEATETISYSMPTFKLDGHYLVYFGAWKDHIGLYPLFGGDDPAHKIFEQYKRENNSIHLPYDEPFPYDVVEKFALLRRDQEVNRKK